MVTRPAGAAFYAKRAQASSTRPVILGDTKKSSKQTIKQKVIKMEIKIVEYDKIREGLNAVKDACNFIPDASTKDGYDKSKRIALDHGKLLTDLEKIRKERKSYWLEGGKQVDSQAKAIKTELEQYIFPHKEAYKAIDSAKKQREQDRKDDLEARVLFIRELPEKLIDSSSSEVRAAIEDLSNEECLDFYEYTEHALKARNASREALSELFSRALKYESEQEELAKLRKESEERNRIESEERIKRETIEAENFKAKAEADRIENERLKRERDREHVGAVRSAAKEALMARGASEDLARKIVLAINAGEIPNVKIIY